MSNVALVPRSYVILVLIVGCCLDGAHAAEPQAVVDDFNQGREGWQIYDYNGGKAGGGNVFFPATWEASGGVHDSGYIWADDSRWRIDTPEKPHSILPFIIYRRWVEGNAIDLRGARLSLYLRGDNLDLKGARCLFWAFNNSQGTRWHYKARPLAIHQGKWGEKQTVLLENDESLWHRSWSRHPETPASPEDVLKECDSYGLSFVGFTDEVTGKFAMDELVIEPAAAVK